VIRERSEELHAFHARHFAEPIGERPASAKGHRSELTDEEVIKLIREKERRAVRTLVVRRRSQLPSLLALALAVALLSGSAGGSRTGGYSTSTSS
jgi:hypothetical protein